MDEIFKFDKTLQKRLEEYSDMFPNGARSVSRIKKEWTFYLELIVQSTGWYAVWKIPRLICEHYKVQYPTMVLVCVESVDFNDHLAGIKILAVKDENVHLPEKHDVKLIQLWLTKDQDESINPDTIYSLANAIDMLRFFYNHILMPWDYDDHDPYWIDKHLETRLHLYYDIRNGVIPRQTAEYLSSLLSEARLLYAKLEMAEAELEEDRINFNTNTANAKLQGIVRMQVRIIQIQDKVELLENPLLRNTILQMQKEHCKKSIKTEPETWVILPPEGRQSGYIQFLKDVEAKVGDKIMKYSTSLISALHDGDFNDSFILNPSKHEIKCPGALEGGGTLKGLYDKNATSIFSKNDDTMLECNGDIVIENLTLDGSSSKYAVVLRHGKVTIKNCKIIGNFGSSTQQGITVLPECKLELLDSEISGFSTAIVGNSNSTIVLRNCEIFSVNIGLQFLDKCKALIQKTYFHNCYEYGVCIETENIGHDVGGFSLLQIVPEVEVQDLTGKDNFKGDVMINQKLKAKSVQGLFPTPDLDSTASDEEMETSQREESELNNTVIENENVIDKHEVASV